MPATISREAYAHRFGPTVGDRVRLADTSLVVQVERDLTTYGEEVTFGGGQVVRDGMGQGQTGWAGGAPDTVVTNALVLDHTGIVKADVSIRDGVIAAIGKAGNPAIQPRVTIPIGPGTEIVAGEGRILTAGGVDTQVHFSGPRQIEAALAAGITTMLGGGTGSAAGTLANSPRTASTPGAWHIGKMIDAADAFAMNLGFAGKGSASTPDALVEQIAGGACALTLHADWGVTPTAIGCCLSVADAHDVQATIHVDAMNEVGFVEDTIAAFEGRTIVAALAGDGRLGAPEVLGIAGLPNLLGSSASVPRGGAPDARVDALTAMEAALHDIGALPMMRSGVGAAGRAGDIVTRAWQTADAMKRRRGALRGDGPRSDNLRARRYIAKYTINPAIAYGIADHVGSVEIGKLADLVLWSPAFFGVAPDLVLKGGVVAAANAGARSHPMFGACAGARVGACLTFVAQMALDRGLAQRLRTQRRLVAVRATRGGIGRQSMILNDTVPHLKIDPKTDRVEADGEPLDCEPVKDLPMTQRYFLF